MTKTDTHSRVRARMTHSAQTYVGHDGMVSAVLERLRTRRDTEHVMSLNRAVFCALMAAYTSAAGIGPAWLPLALLSAGLAVTGLIFALILASPKPNVTRRTVAMVLDIFVISFVMHLGDKGTSCFYPLLLWTIFGNGFRFGVRDLLRATGFTLIAFATMAATTPFWQQNASLAAGLLIGTMIVPAYAGTLIRSLTIAREKAEEANNVKTNFVANISHDLRTPLQAMVGTSELLLDTELTPKQAELVSLTSSASKALLAMVNDILKFTMLESSKHGVESATFNVVELVRDVVKISSQLRREKNLGLFWHLDPGLPVLASGGQQYITDILLNLVGNALKFTSTGGVLITARMTGKANDVQWLRFEVVDTGIGVPEHAQETIFARFTQADEEIRHKFGGTGLGLAICKSLVEELGGLIGVDSIEGRGSTFWIEVPVAAEPDLRAKIAAPALLKLALPATLAKGRLVNEARAQSREVTDLDLGNGAACLATTVAAAMRERTILAIETPASPEAVAEIQCLTKDMTGAGLCILLVDTRPDIPAQLDPRWAGHVRLPFQFDDAQMRAALALCEEACGPVSVRSGPAAPRPGEQPRGTILVVDDNKTNQVIFAKVLAEQGYTVEIAADGEKALAAMERQAFHLVLMDVNMPVIDGLKATKLQRLAELGMRRTPIIGLTADATPRMRDACFEAGMDDCLVKPITPQALIAATVQAMRPAPTAPKAVPAIEPAKPVDEIDWQPLDGLARLGGKDFINEVLGEFVTDMRGIVSELYEAAAQEDFARTRVAAHALASTAANVGATNVRRLGLNLERLPDADIKRDGLRLAVDARDGVRRFLVALGDATDVPQQQRTEFG